jgi:hypothetical protein
MFSLPPSLPPSLQHYLEARAQAIEDVESHIVELGYDLPFPPYSPPSLPRCSGRLFVSLVRDVLSEASICSPSLPPSLPLSYPLLAPYLIGWRT